MSLANDSSPVMIRDTSAQDVRLSPTPGRRTRRIALWSGAGLAVIVGAALLLTAWRATSHSVNASRLRIAPVTQGTLVRDAVVSGRVVAAVSPTLFAPAAGTVTLKVNAGDTVKQGDVLAEIESPDLRDQLKREQSATEQMEAEVARQQILARKQKLLAQRDADTAEIERVAALRMLERIEKAGVEGIIAKNDFMKAQDALRSAEVRSKHAAAAATLESDDVNLEMKTKQSQLARQKLALDYAQRRVDELAIRAPLAGVIGSLATTNKTVVAVNAPLLTLVDLSVLEVELEIPETYATDIGVGMNAEITTNDGKAIGTLSALAPEVVKNLVLARVRFNGTQPPNLRQSQRVSARLLIDERPNVLLLPRGSFVDQDGGRFAYVVVDDVAERRPIRIGATSVSAVEIIEGLKAGDQVVVAGSEMFENAQRVSLNR